MNEAPRPDLAGRSLTANCKCSIKAQAASVYTALTDGWESWFAEPGTSMMMPREGLPFFFYNKLEWGRHPHYGRFLKLVENELVEMTWLTGNGTDEGTAGAETVLRFELEPDGDGTTVHLTHSGFVSDTSRDGHAENWPLALEELGKALASSS